jgi:hypothetical protein
MNENSLTQSREKWSFDLNVALINLIQWSESEQQRGGTLLILHECD